jgi:hypothetical protein
MWVGEWSDDSGDRVVVRRSDGDVRGVLSLSFGMCLHLLVAKSRQIIQSPVKPRVRETKPVKETFESEDSSESEKDISSIVTRTKTKTEVRPYDDGTNAKTDRSDFGIDVDEHMSDRIDSNADDVDVDSEDDDDSDSDFVQPGGSKTLPECSFCSANIEVQVT